jgi:hypothetical protein
VMLIGPVGTFAGIETMIVSAVTRHILAEDSP